MIPKPATGSRAGLAPGGSSAGAEGVAGGEEVRARALPGVAGLILCACARGGGRPSTSPAGLRVLRSYVLVIPERDALDSAVAHLLRDRGFRVWPGVRGGSGPAAALIS